LGDAPRRRERIEDRRAVAHRRADLQERAKDALAEEE
jgi:hypothetical protein